MADKQWVQKSIFNKAAPQPSNHYSMGALLKIKRTSHSRWFKCRYSAASTPAPRQPCGWQARDCLQDSLLLRWKPCPTQLKYSFRPSAGANRYSGVAETYSAWHTAALHARESAPRTVASMSRSLPYPAAQPSTREWRKKTR